MSTLSLLRRARGMTGRELGFRASAALRIHRDRIRHRIRPSSWDRRALATILSADVPAFADVSRLIRAGAWDRLEAALAQHFARRQSPWPVSARDSDDIAAAIASRFPSARREAEIRADRITQGRYDLLGHRDLAYGPVPDWHLDAAHWRSAPRRFWADVPYLDPACGDHKVIWELNRHQHWTSLGRAFRLGGNARYAEVFVDQLYSWLEANPPLTGINWASMLELAFRSISWTWALELFAGIAAATADGRPWRTDLLLALDRQLAHVAENLSQYFSPNTHLSGEALALYVVSLALPELRGSPARAALGRDVLLEQSRRQVLPDGGHAERSTHYHRYSTDFYLLATIVGRRSGDPAADDLAACATAQADVLRTLADERGGLQTIGDDDGGQLFAMCGTPPWDVRTTLAIAAEVLGEPSLAVSPPSEEACWVLGGPPSPVAPRGVRITEVPAPWPSRLLPETGYFVSRAPRELVIFDAGPHGFLNGGHAHGDALAVVASVGSRPLLIDPGTGTYTMDPQLRDRLRAGRMHNTLLVDGEEHAAMRGPFHWTRTTDAAFLLAHAGDRWDAAQGVHDGYPARRHVRTLFAIHGAGWLIVDQILGKGTHRAESFWHIDPAWMPEANDGVIRFAHADGVDSFLATTATSVEIVRDGPWAIHAPEYGRIEPAPFIRVEHESEAPFAVATFLGSGAAASPDTRITVHSCAAPDGWAGVAAVLTARAFELTVLTAAPEASAPDWREERYGIPGFQTTARAAILVRDARGAWTRTTGLANGDVREKHGGAVSRDELACAVHEVSR